MSDITNAAYSNAQAQTDQQKRALLAAIAQGGTAGQDAYKSGQGQVEQSRQAALGQLMQPGFANGGAQFGAEQQAITNAPFLQRQADLAQGAAVFGQDVQRQQSANEDYFNKVGAAVPVEQAVTERQVAKIQAQQAEAEASRQNQIKMQEMELQKAKAGSVSENLALQAAQENHKQDIFNNVLQSYATDEAGNENSARSNAINKIINLGVPVEEAWTGVPNEDKNAIRDAVNKYFQNLGGTSPFTAYDAQWQAAHKGGGMGGWLRRQGVPV